MKHERIDSRSRVWTVTRGPDGRLREELDTDRLAALEGVRVDDADDALIRAAGEMEIAQTRVW